MTVPEAGAGEAGVGDQEQAGAVLRGVTIAGVPAVAPSSSADVRVHQPARRSEAAPVGSAVAGRVTCSKSEGAAELLVEEGEARWLLRPGRQATTFRQRPED